MTKLSVAAAIGAENPAVKETNALMKPSEGPYVSRRYTYSPPASGIMEPNSE